MRKTPPAAAAAPAPRAFHASWEFGDNVYVHGGEGPAGGARAASGDSEVDDIFGCVGRDPFAEEDGGAPLESGRVATAATARSGSTLPWGSSFRKKGGASSADVAKAGQKRRNERNASPAVSVLEDLWKLDPRTMLWERLSTGQGTWERHRPAGSAPTPRQGHSFTAVANGKRLVLFGGLAENGELLSDIQILETEGGSLSWATVQAPVGDIPSARHRHSACEVPVAAGYAGGVTQGGGSVLVFGGQGRASEGPGIRSTDFHETLLYDPKESRWRAVETGHAFPASRHGHSMPMIAGWTPPSFHPDGTLAAAELAPQTKTAERDPSDKTTNNPGSAAAAPAAAVAAAAVAAAAKLPSDMARFQWGERPPSCAVVFGGLNSMYVNPEVWILPLRWRENTVQFSPPSPEPGPPQEETGKPHSSERGGGGGLGGLDFATTVRLKRASGLAATKARGRVAAAAAAGGGVALSGSGTKDDTTWRLFQAGRVGGAGAGAGKHRRASLPGGFATGAAALGLEILRSQEQRRRQEIEVGMMDGVGGGAEVGGQGDDGDRGGMQGSAAEIEAELIRLKKLVYVSGEKLSVEVSTRMRLEEMNKDMRREVKELRISKEAAELQLREEIKHHWHEGQKAKARCSSLERLLAEAYDLINMIELQHVRSWKIYRVP
eukprot:g10959.t1